MIEIKSHISKKRFEKFIDNMIAGLSNQVDPGIIESFDGEQNLIFHFVRKSLNRINYKNL